VTKLKQIAFEIKDYKLLEKSPLESLQALQKWQRDLDNIQ